MSTWMLMGVVALMAANRLLFVWDGWSRTRLPFWSLQLINLLAACALALWGIPELKARGLQIFNLMFVGLLVLHILGNNSKLRSTQRARRSRDTQARQDAEQAIRSRLVSAAPQEE